MRVSVIIPTYNRYKLLKRAINSVMAQTYSKFEIIVVDDGSSDETSKIVDDFPDLKYYFQENSGVSSARNLGVAKASYEWVAFLDSDDEWHKEKLEKQVDFHRKNLNVLMSYSDETWLRNGLEVKVPKKFAKVGGEIFDKCLSHCIIAPSATMIEKKFFQNLGGFDENLEVCEDYDLWLRVSLKQTIGLLDEKLIVKYGGDSDQLSTKHWGMDRFRVMALEKIYELSETKRERVKKELVKKYSLLLKGAIKYDKIIDIDFYRERIRYYDGV